MPDSGPSTGRFVLIAAVTALITAPLTAIGTYTVQSKMFGKQRETRILSEKRQVYSQIRGQEALLLQIARNFLVTKDLAEFYTGNAVRDKTKGAPSTLASFGESETADALAKERLGEQYQNQLVTCEAKLYEAFGQAHLLFSPDPELDRLIQIVEDLPDVDFPTPNKEELRGPGRRAYLQSRSQQALREVSRQYGQPIEAILSRLETRIKEN